MKVGQWFVLTVYDGSIPRRIVNIDVLLFSRFWFGVDIAFSPWLHRVRVLANGDIAPASEVIVPDDWRNQPLRPNGLPW